MNCENVRHDINQLRAERLDLLYDFARAVENGFDADDDQYIEQELSYIDDALEPLQRWLKEHCE